MMDASDDGALNRDQENYWNSKPGEKWITFQKDIDTAFASINDRLIELSSPMRGEHVLDVGCGTGATSMAFAQTVGSDGRVLGLDISGQLLSLASERAKTEGHHNVEYQLADAQSHRFEAGQFDLVTSRFGLMFFADPVAAFANLATGLKAGGRMCFVSWARIDGNPWFEVPRDAAVARLGDPPASAPTAPGPLAFADIDYVIDILRAAGLGDVRGTEEEVLLFNPGSVEDVAYVASNIGPSARIVKVFNGTAEDVAAISRDVADGFRKYIADGELHIPAKLNFFDAIRSAV